jgi:pilus assembly protein Flp/PilA
MKQLTTRVRQFLVSEDGPTAVEYAVLVGLIVVALVSVVTNLSKSISGTFSAVSSVLPQSS